ncbi:putative disease resistance protein RGA3 [Camellia lanceoleosa]|uniref:Disease resistance protein RGA3 n=1 Tax=Camellia lanceoleosa TaxID=1840588 RepID=A0ACC0FIB6_9ERIC|nr:putative disease resistance protein RGA3 [Camellia lanceoleosa]
MAVPFLLPPVIENLNSLLHNKVALLSGVDKEMKKLSSTLSTIHAVLEDAEQKQLQDKAIHTWLSVQPKHSNANLKAKDPPLLLSRGRKFGSLRTFDARRRPMTEFPSSIGNLKHWYLNLSNAHIKALPDSICSLLNLQTLILDNCQKLERLPQNMMYLRSVRHVFLKWCRLIEMPPKIGQLTYLKTLTVFVVGKSTDCNLLAESLNLGGELCIEHLERVRNPMDEKEANLVGKQNLSLMELNWEYSLAESESENDESESQEIDEAESQEIDEFESSENVEFKNIVNVLMVAAARIEVVVASEALSAGRFWAVHGFEAN